MDNLAKYNQAFIAVFKVQESDLNDNFIMKNVAVWDSIRHLNLINQLEDSFDIMFETEDILSFRSYSEGKTILSKYSVNL